MTSSLSKYASSLILLEWGAIMLYFNLSGRVSAFLHPNFRPLLWLVGVSLALTAVIIAFAHKSECCGADEALSTHDHGLGAHHHEHSHQGAQAHKGLTAASVMSFLVLCVPIALAAVISPDRFGETFLRNRGTIESVRVLPGSEAKSAPQPSAENSSLSANSNSNALPSLTDSRVDAASTVPASAEPMLPASDEDSEESTAAEYQNPALRPDKEGNIHAEVIDLLYACEDPSMRKDFEGKQVAMIGQVAHRNKTQHERGPFQLIRFVMVCCAADVQPIAVLVQYPKTAPDFELMSWVKVIGKVRFQTVDDHLEPVVDALKVAPIPQPADQYLY
jgi:uncharacterized repeat protein (TIGR03943 family)